MIYLLVRTMSNLLRKIQDAETSDKSQLKTWPLVRTPNARIPIDEGLDVQEIGFKPDGAHDYVSMQYACLTDPYFMWRRFLLMLQQAPVDQKEVIYNTIAEWFFDN